MSTRTTKHRIWHSDQGIYFTQPYTYAILLDGTILAHVGQEQFVNVTQDSLVVEQFTGLKDKNGKEIYEGDIVNRIATDSRPDEKPDPRWGEPVKCLATIYAVEYASPKGRFELVKHYPGGNHCWADFNEIRLGIYEVTHEVVGNIHEHPHLLSS